MIIHVYPLRKLYEQGNHDWTYFGEFGIENFWRIESS